MASQDVRIENLNESLLDDRISVCGENQPVEQPSIKLGIKEKKEWLRKMLKETGSPTKVLYVNNRPEGQIQFYPETSIPFLKDPDPKTLHVMCSFIHLAHQGNGYGKKLFNNLLDDVKRDGRVESLDTLSFDPPGCGLALSVFWKRLGFRERPDGKSNELQYPIRGGLTRPRRANPKSVDEKGVKIFYQPTCIFTHHFNDKLMEAIRAIDPEITVEKINMWEKPEIARARNLVQSCVYINGKPMEHSIFDGEAFKNELRDLLGSKS